MDTNKYSIEKSLEHISTFLLEFSTKISFLTQKEAKTLVSGIASFLFNMIDRTDSLQTNQSDQHQDFCPGTSAGRNRF